MLVERSACHEVYQYGAMSWLTAAGRPCDDSNRKESWVRRRDSTACRPRSGLMKRTISTLTWLWFFFANYLWLGIVIILASVIANDYFSIPPSLSPPFSIKVLIDTTEAIGIAIVIASIFTYASGTSEFMTKIRELLQDIVVSRDFLGNIDSASKREALSAILKPSTEERNIYSNIEDYYNYYISQTLDISKKCVRSNYTVYYRAYWDNKTKRVAADGIYQYRLYPTVDGYGD